VRHGEWGEGWVVPAVPPLATHDPLRGRKLGVNRPPAPSRPYSVIVASESQCVYPTGPEPVTSSSARQVCSAPDRIRLSGAVVRPFLTPEHPTLHEWDLGRLEARIDSVRLRGTPSTGCTQPYARKPVERVPRETGALSHSLRWNGIDGQAARSVARYLRVDHRGRRCPGGSTAPAG